jgi:hypothetical protein
VQGRLGQQLKKAARFHAQYGTVAAIKRTVVLALRLDPYRNAVRRRKGQDLAAIFSEIHDRNLWSERESRSGKGSTLAYTAPLRGRLTEVLRTLSIRSMLDAPCGDFNWMATVPFPDGFAYTGADIVPVLIERNQRLHGGSGRRFQVLDITRDPLPSADLFFCRDCLFHLGNEQVLAVLQNFAEGDIPYLMTSTHVNTDDFDNVDVYSGGFRLIDLFRPPYGLPRDVVARVEDYLPPDPPREMCVWTRAQVRRSLGMDGATAI